MTTPKTYGNLFSLDDRQQRAINKAINDSRARYIEVPTDFTVRMVSVLQGDGQKIGEVPLSMIMKSGFCR